MRIVFAGTPDFAATALAAIIDAAPRAGWTVPLVLTQPDRPAGRGLRLAPSPVKQLATAHGIAVATPVSLRKGDSALAARNQLKALDPDLLVVAAYGLILPQDVLDIPRGIGSLHTPKLSALNIHASLLPRWRGAAPIVRAIEAGDTVTGVTLMQMDAGLDTGPMLLARSIPIEPEETAATLTSKLSQLGATLVVDALRDADALVATPQGDGDTYASKIGKAEAWLDWSASAVELERKVRAFDPFPVACTTLGGTTVRVWRAQVVGDPVQGLSADIGLVRAADRSGLRVACGKGDLLMTELQRAGSKRVTASEFLSGFPVRRGDRFVSPVTAVLE